MSTTPKYKVELHFYRAEHFSELSAYHLPDVQKQFTGMPEDVLSLSLNDKERAPIVIEADGKAVGFLVLHAGDGIKSFTMNPKAVLLRAFSINIIHQGKGFAKKAMFLLPQFVKDHYQDKNEIVLAVNEKNIAAQKLYFQAGFKDLGERREGSIGNQLILKFCLEEKNNSNIG